MGRPSHTRALSIWTNGQRVGLWTFNRRGEHGFAYDQEWMASDAARPLSLSMPFTGDQAIRGERVRNFFDNLLPDSDPIRNRIASRFKTESSQAFDLLQAIGRDCVGAIQLLGPDEFPTDVQTIQGTPLSDSDVEALLIQATRSSPLPGLDDQDELRISLAGAQEKTALLFHKGQWMRPQGSTPTTHILKLPMGLVGNAQADFSSSVENEWLCMNILSAFGLPVAKTEIVQFGSQKALAVERFDRQMHSSGNWLMRLPQEDFCQAMGLPSRLKYEADGGPGIADLARILKGSIQSDRDLTTLFTAQLLFWLMAAPDGHAKNFSIRVLPQGRYALTPLYDVMSIWPVVGSGPGRISMFKAKMAMAIVGKNKHYLFKDVQHRHFASMGTRLIGSAATESALESVISQLPSALESVAQRLPISFPQSLMDAVFDGMQTFRNRLAHLGSALE